MRYLFILCILTLASCTTNTEILDFSGNTENSTVLQKGLIQKNTTLTKDTIVVDGDFTDYTFSSFGWFFDEKIVVERNWNGVVYCNEHRYDFDVIADVDYIEHGQDWNDDGEIDIAESNPSKSGIDSVRIENMPVRYNIKSFELPAGGGGYFKFTLKEKDFPAHYMDFSVANKKFSVVLTKMIVIPNIIEGWEAQSTYNVSFIAGEQVFYIVDNKGQVYAEFITSFYEPVKKEGDTFGKFEYRDGRYTIYDVDSTFDELQLIPIIGFIDIIKYMQQYDMLDAHVIM